MTDELLRQFEEELQTDYSAMEEQRDQANEELRFAMVPGGQWEDYLEDSYEGRVKLELDEVSDYLFREHGKWLDNPLMPCFSPDDDDSSEDDAELLTGLLRRDHRRANGQYAIDTAAFESSACGVGAFKLSTQYEDDEDEDNHDQIATFDPIHNAYSMVVWDSAAARADKSDATRCTLLIPYTKEQFGEQWPEANQSDAMRPDDRSHFNWRSEKDEVYVACRYHVERKRETVYTYANLLTGEQVKLESKDEDQELTNAGFELISERKVRRRVVFKTLFTGTEILEEKRRVAGKYIPIIPFYGYRAFIDGQETFFGLVRKRMDSQRVMNMVLSLAAESAAHGPEDKLIFSPEQMSNAAIKASWEGNRHQKSYLLADPITDDQGNILHTGPAGVAPGATLSQAAQALISFVGEHMQKGTGGAPQDISDPDASGKAINAIIKRVDMNTRMIANNRKDSLEHFGRVYREIAKEIYTDRIGRSAKVVGIDGKSSMVQLMQPQAENGQFSYKNDLSKGRFECTVDIGPSYETQREETVEALKDLYTAVVGANPSNPLADVLLNKLIVELPMNGMDDIKEYVRRSQLLQGVIEPETPEDQQVLEQAGIRAGEDPQKKLLDAATKEQETEAAKNMQEIKESDADIEAKLAKARRDNVEADAQEIDNALAKLGVGVVERRASV